MGTRPSSAPETRASLLVRLRDPGDQQAWGQFVDVYAPLIYRHVRRRGLQDADAADVAQEVLRAVARTIGRFEYDPDRGRFRGWLFRITQNELRDFLARRARQVTGTGDSGVQQLLASLPGAVDPVDWDRECQDRLLEWAYEKVRSACEPTTWHAFRLTAIEGQTGESAAGALGISVGAVYVAKSRVIFRLRQILQAWESEL